MVAHREGMVAARALVAHLGLPDPAMVADVPLVVMEVVLLQAHDEGAAALVLPVAMAALVAGPAIVVGYWPCLVEVRWFPATTVAQVEVVDPALVGQFHPAVMLAVPVRAAGLELVAGH